MASNLLSFHVFHVGTQDPVVREHVNSIRRQYPASRIVYITDSTSVPPETTAIDSVSRYEFKSSSIMHSRLFAYAAEPIIGPTFFLDTDILVNKPLPIKLFSALSGSTAVCRREYNNDAPFNSRFRGIDFSRFEGMSVGNVFPYLACCTYSESSDIWHRCLQTMENLDECFYQWYGDQEALKLVQEELARASQPFKELPESLFAALPTDPNSPQAYFIHYKGQFKDRLRHMIDSGYVIE